jgi:hypothetical protein
MRRILDSPEDGKIIPSQLSLLDTKIADQPD